MSNLVIDAKNISKSFKDGKDKITIFSEFNFALGLGEQVAITGASGSGKSTLLQVLAGLDKPDSGEITIAGYKNFNQLPDAKQSEIRNHNIGFVYQFHHLLPEFSALENVMMPLIINKTSTTKAKKVALDLLAQLGLADRVEHRPSELSGGERQRTAIARAMVMQPKLVMADEPTGNLDPNTAKEVYDALLALNKAQGTSLLMVTHDLALAGKMDKVFSIG